MLWFAKIWKNLSSKIKILKFKARIKKFSWNKNFELKMIKNLNLKQSSKINFKFKKYFLNFSFQSSIFIHHSSTFSRSSRSPPINYVKWCLSDAKSTAHMQSIHKKGFSLNWYKLSSCVICIKSNKFIKFILIWSCYLSFSLEKLIWLSKVELVMAFDDY